MAVLAGALSTLRRAPDLSDLSREEEPFKSMALPSKSVVLLYYMDGGTIVVGVTDKNDHQEWVTFPIDRDGVFTSYKTAYPCSLNDAFSGSVAPLKNPSRARRILVGLYKKYGDKSAEDYEFNLKAFSEPPSETGRKIYRKLFD